MYSCITPKVLTRVHSRFAIGLDCEFQELIVNSYCTTLTFILCICSKAFVVSYLRSFHEKVGYIHL